MITINKVRTSEQIRHWIIQVVFRGVGLTSLGHINWFLSIHFFYKQPVYKQPMLRPLKNVATFEAQKSAVAVVVLIEADAFLRLLV